MESTGLPGAVHLSAESFDLLRLATPEAAAAFERRRVEVKGRGVMDTMLLPAGGRGAAAVLAELPRAAEAGSRRGSAEHERGAGDVPRRGSVEGRVPGPGRASTVW